MPRFEVRTIDWVDEYCTRPGLFARLPGWKSLGRYDTFAAADAEAERIDRAKWAETDFNPFAYGGGTLYFQSTMPPGVLCDFLEDRGIDPPAVGHSLWSVWWASHRPAFPPDHVAAVREALNLVRFTEVVAVPPTLETGYVIQELHWSGTDIPFLDADFEGGTFIAVYQDRAAADGRCAELNANRKAGDHYLGYRRFSTQFRKGARDPHFTWIDETPFFEVVTLDFEPVGVRPLAVNAFVVYRQVYAVNRPLRDPHDRTHASRFALRVFSNGPAAEAFVVGLMRTAYRRTNPFSVLELEAKGQNQGVDYRKNVPFDGACVAGVLALGVPFSVPPQTGWEQEYWELWYDDEAPNLSDANKVKVWSLFDAQPLYGVMEVPLEG